MSIFKKLLQAVQAPEPDDSLVEDLAMAKAIILIEMAEYDESFDTTEKTCIMRLLEQEFQLSREEVGQLLQQARQYRKDQGDLFYATRRLNEGLTTEQKEDFMVQVWKVVLADGRIDYSEDVLTRKLIQLLRLERKSWIVTRDRAKAELGE